MKQMHLDPDRAAKKAVRKKKAAKGKKFKAKKFKNLTSAEKDDLLQELSERAGLITEEG